LDYFVHTQPYYTLFKNSLNWNSADILVLLDVN
jgi:hypothetical protein